MSADGTRYIRFKNGTNVDTVYSAVSIVNVVGGGMGVGAPVPATVSFAQGDPTAGKGTISVSKNGTYTIKVMGYSAQSCGLSAIPMTGGEAPSPGAGPAPAGGNWGPITLTGLSTGQYLVFGQVTIKNGTITVPILSPGAIVNVQ